MNDNSLKKKKAYIGSKAKTDNWIFHPFTCFAILIITLSLDYMVMDKFFLDLRYKNTLAPTLGVLFVIDVMPMFLLPAYKYRYSKVEKSPSWMLILATSILALKMCMIIGVKISIMDRLNEKLSMPITIPRIFLEALIPLGTSMVNGLSAWNSFHPLKKRIIRAESRRAELEYEKMIIHSQKAKYDVCTDDYRKALENQINKKYNTFVRGIYATMNDLKLHFRNILAERLADPRSASHLSSIQENNIQSQKQLPESIDINDFYDNIVPSIGIQNSYIPNNQIYGGKNK
ncbi:MAG: hypothetical protein FWG88_09365 [Oscillospiraceae bacterium]|nr:hypothetical protein [Oscillospiraceae bacterium]